MLGERTSNSFFGKSYWEGDNMYLLLQERSLDWLCWTIKEQDKAGNQSVNIQSALCEENSHGLKITVVKI